MSMNKKRIKALKRGFNISFIKLSLITISFAEQISIPKHTIGFSFTGYLLAWPIKQSLLVKLVKKSEYLIETYNSKVTLFNETSLIPLKI